jgi:transcriptional regulator with XRE-family HTH domain
MTEKQKAQKEFADNLQKLLKKKSMSLHQLAASSGLEYAQVQRIATAKVNPTLYTIIRLAEGLDIHPSELLKY